MRLLLALAAACDQVKGTTGGDPRLVDDVMRLVDEALRFLEQDRAIWEARQIVLERLENVPHLIELDMTGPYNRRSKRSITTARAHSVEAINHLQAQIMRNGRVNAAGDRVGLGKVGTAIR